VRISSGALYWGREQSSTSVLFPKESNFSPTIFSKSNMWEGGFMTSYSTFEIAVFEEMTRVFLARGQRVFKLIMVEQIEDS
jgi:hypothetical protein